MPWEVPEGYIGHRYWNTGGKGICIAAKATPEVDWAAYIGADDGQSEEACFWEALHQGAKLTEQEARAFFPSVGTLHYRY